MKLKLQRRRARQRRRGKRRAEKQLPSIRAALAMGLITTWSGLNYHIGNRNRDLDPTRSDQA